MTAIYMAVTADRYELPCVIADSSMQLARKCGVTRDYLNTCIRTGKPCEKLKMRFFKISED